MKEKYFKKNTHELIRQFLIIFSQTAYETFKSLFTWLKLYAYVAIVQQQFKLETSFNSWVAEEGLLNSLGASCTTFIVHLSFILLMMMILWYLVANCAWGHVIAFWEYLLLFIFLQLLLFLPRNLCVLWWTEFQGFPWGKDHFEADERAGMISNN